MKKPSLVLRGGDYELHVIRSIKDTYYIVRIVQKYSSERGGKVRKRMYFRTNELLEFFKLFYQTMQFVGVPLDKKTRKMIGRVKK